MNFNTPLLTKLMSERNAQYAQKTTMIAEIAKLRARLAEGSGNAGNAADNRLRSILGEPVLPDTRPDMQLLQEMLQELNILNGTIGLLDGRINAEKAIASRQLCEEERPEVDKRGKAFADAFVKLHKAQLEYHSYLDKIRDTGASAGSLPHIFISGLGDAKDRSGTFYYGARDFVEAGYLSDMPKELK